MSNPYETLGVAKGASKAAIRHAYKQKAKKHHPDRDGGDHDVMAEVNEAYALLNDDKRREKFDSSGNTAQQPSVEDRAMQSLAKAFDDMLAEEAPQGNVVAIISKAVNEAILRFQFEIRKIEHYLTKLDQKAHVVTKKTEGGVDLWANVVAQRRQRYQQSLEHTKDMLAVAEKSKELLIEYQGVDPPSPVRRAGATLFSDWTIG
jgi:curved DNA-binding protein CbpA